MVSAAGLLLVYKKQAGAEWILEGDIKACFDKISHTWLHRHVSSKQTFVKVDDAIFRALWQWARRRHPKKPGRWVKEKYFHAIGHRNWVFCGEVEEQDGTTRKVPLLRTYGPDRAAHENQRRCEPI